MTDHPLRMQANPSSRPCNCHWCGIHQIEHDVHNTCIEFGCQPVTQQERSDATSTHNPTAPNATDHTKQENVFNAAPPTPIGGMASEESAQRESRSMGRSVRLYYAARRCHNLA